MVIRGSICRNDGNNCEVIEVWSNDKDVATGRHFCGLTITNNMTASPLFLLTLISFSLLPVSFQQDEDIPHHE